MGEKDIAEKHLEAHNDVFADIINGVLFDGRPVISEYALVDASTTSQYKADSGKLHEQERDVAKYWLEQNCTIRLAMIGIENQTAIDRLMPLRVIGYDGVAYRDQLNQNADVKHFYPVITVVLYFGKKPWTTPLSLHDVVDIPEPMKPFFNDYKINIIDVPRMKHEQIQRFSSDFEYIADYFIHGGEFTISKKPIRHVDATMKLMSVLSNNKKYEEYVNIDDDSKEAINMSDILDRLWAQGETRGREAGLAEGMAKGEARGKQAGLAEGKEANRKDMVLGMIRENISLDVIARVAKLSVEQIKEIAKSAAVL